MNINHTDNFPEKELRCRCGCKTACMDSDFMDKVEILRSLLGSKPLYVNSGFRCPKHNAEIGGVSNSRHTFGSALDIHKDDLMDVNYFMDLAPKLFEECIEHKTFIHIASK